MIPDLNILLYAVDQSSAYHNQAKSWLEKTLNTEGEEVGIPWAVYLGFLRLTTSQRFFRKPLSIEQACGLIDSLMDSPIVTLLNPGIAHRGILRHLLFLTGTGRNLVTDAHLAALALENNAVFVTGDRDFLRFPGLKVHLLF